MKIILGVGCPISRGSIPDRGNIQTYSGAHPTSYAMDTGELFPQMIKQQVYETDHSPPSCSTETNNGGAMVTLCNVFMA